MFKMKYYLLYFYVMLLCILVY